MKFAELNKKYNEYCARHDGWLNSLFNAAVALRTKISEQLDPPAPWDDNGKQRPYVNLNKLPNGGEEPQRLTPPDMHTNSEGVFTFAISLTFERAANTYPKKGMWQAVGVRMLEGRIEYCLWDRDTDRVGKDGWVCHEGGVDLVLESFSKYFDFDPASNFANRPKLGFV